MWNLNYEKVNFILVTLLFSIFFIRESTGGANFIFFITIIIFTINILKNKFTYKILIDQYQIMVLVFASYCILTSMWAKASSNSISSGLAIVKILISLSIVYGIYSKYLFSTYKLLKIIMYSGYLISIYALYYYGLTEIINCILVGKRLPNAFANINSISIIGVFSILIYIFCYIFGYMKIKYILLNIFPLLIILGGGSKKALIALIMGSLLLFLFRYKKKSFIKKILYSGMIVILGGIFFKGILTLPIFENLNNRMQGMLALITHSGEIDNSTRLRQGFIEVGIEQFKKTPILGIGMDNTFLISTQVKKGFETYLHNNYIEILIGGGILAFILYYSIFGYILLKFWRYRKVSDSTTKMCLILLLLLLILDYGMVSYYYKSTYFYFMIFFLEIRRLKKKERYYRMKKLSYIGGEKRK